MMSPADLRRPCGASGVPWRPRVRLYCRLTVPVTGVAISLGLPAAPRAWAAGPCRTCEDSKPGNLTGEWDVAGPPYTWAADLQAGTTVAISARPGNTATPDGAWSSFAPLASSGATVGATSRHLRYRLDLTASAAGQTPAQSDIPSPMGKVRGAGGSSMHAQQRKRRHLVALYSIGPTQRASRSLASTTPNGVGQ